MKEYKNSGLETDKDHHQSIAKQLLRKLYQIKRKHILKKLIENIIDNSEKRWEFFRSSGMKLAKLSQLKIALNKYSTI